MFDHNAITGYERPLDNGGVAMAKMEHRLPCQFYWKEKRVKEGEPLHRKVEYIKIFLAGGDIVDRPVKEADRQQYANAYHSFMRNEEQPVDGWPLAQVPWLDVGQVATYKALNIPTMEALAAAPDTAIQGLMGAMKHREMAKNAIETLKGEQPMMRLTEENTQLKEKIELQGKQILELCEEMEKLKNGRLNAFKE